MECGNLSEIIRFFEKTICILQNVWYIICHNADLWCNGSTSDSGSLCRGSNPCRSAIFFAIKTDTFVIHEKKSNSGSENKIFIRSFSFWFCSFFAMQKMWITHYWEVAVAFAPARSGCALRRILAGLPFFLP